MKKAKSKLEIVNPNAAGIDIGSAVHYVCVPEGGDEQRVQKFGCFTEDLHNLYQFSLLASQIGNIAELFDCGIGKRSNKFAQSALKQSNSIVYLIAQNVLFYV